MTGSTDCPLATFYIVAYNQERYVREAVEGALAQTYLPLEIVLSDDCSGDGTFDVMREMAELYRGPHTVRLNRNPRNLGIVPHVNLVASMASGDLLIAGAGDDVSVPSRTAEIVAQWCAEPDRPDGLCSGYVEVGDGDQKVVSAPERFDIEDHCRRGTTAVLGATAAWTRRLSRKWGPLPAEGLAEDQILTSRAELSAGMKAVPQPLVRSRRTRGVGATGVSRVERALWSCPRARRFLEVYESDLVMWSAGNPDSGPVARKLLRLVRRTRRLAERDEQALAGRRLQLLGYCARLLLGRVRAAPAPLLARSLMALEFFRSGVLAGEEASPRDPQDHRAVRGKL